MANLISLERVSLVFGTSHVLDDVSLGVLTGDRIGVVGVNGGGKSTLLRVMAGLQDADSGRITKQGGADGIRIGMLAQEDALDPGVDVARPCSVTCPSTCGPATPASVTS